MHTFHTKATAVTLWSGSKAIASFYGPSEKNTWQSYYDCVVLENRFLICDVTNSTDFSRTMRLLQPSVIAWRCLLRD